MGAALSKDSILGAQDLKQEVVPVPEWGGEVLVRGMRGTERDSFEMSMLSTGADGEQRYDPQNIRARVLVRCIVNEQGARVFDDADAVALGTKDGQVLDRLYEVARRLSGMGKKAEDDAAKNSTPAQS